MQSKCSMYLRHWCLQHGLFSKVTSGIIVRLAQSDISREDVDVQWFTSEILNIIPSSKPIQTKLWNYYYLISSSFLSSYWFRLIFKSLGNSGNKTRVLLQENLHICLCCKGNEKVRIPRESSFNSETKLNKNSVYKIWSWIYKSKLSYVGILVLDLKVCYLES